MVMLIILLHVCLAVISIVHGQDQPVDAVKMIKSEYGTRKNWQEHQCIVGNYSCESYSSPRIISLNLSSSRLFGKITLSNLTSTKSSIGDDLNLGISGPCQKNKEMVIIQVIVAVISSTFFLLAITILWSFKRIKQHGTFQEYLADRNSKALSWEDKYLNATERIVCLVCKKLPSRFACSQSLIETTFRYIDEINDLALDFENNCIDFVIEIPKNSTAACKILIEASFRFTDEIINQAFGFENYYTYSVMEFPKISINGCKILIDAILNFIDEIIQESFGFENHSIDSVIEIPQKSITGGKTLIIAILRFINEIIKEAFGFENHSFDSLRKIPQKTLTGGKTLIGVILRFIDEIIKEAFGFENHSIDSVIEISQVTITGGKILLGAILRFIDEIIKEAFGFETHSIDSVIEIPQKTISVGKTLIGTISSFVEEINNTVLGFESRWIEFEIEIQRTSITGLIEAIFRFINEINKRAFGFRNPCIALVMGIPFNFITGCKILIEVIFKFINEITIEAFGFENCWIDLVIKEESTRKAICETLISRYMAKLIKVCNDDYTQVMTSIPRNEIEEESTRKAICETLISADMAMLTKVCNDDYTQVITSRPEDELEEENTGKDICETLISADMAELTIVCNDDYTQVITSRPQDEIEEESTRKDICETFISTDMTMLTKVCNKDYTQVITSRPEDEIEEENTGKDICETLISADMAELTIVCNDDYTRVITSRPQDEIEEESTRKAICEVVILPTKEFCCPFKDCLAVLTKDDGRVIIQSECHNCNRLVCTQCEVPWHFGTECAEFQSLNFNEKGREDILIAETSINIPLFMCEICVESKPKNESFDIKGCLHFYCTECIINYVASKLQENVTSIRCPVLNCEGLLDPEYCRAVLPLELFERWGKALCESAILGNEKLYCPFTDCSMLLINDGGDPGATNHLKSQVKSREWWCFVNQEKRKQIGNKVITQSECPNCNRLFCAQCKVSWHSGFSCAEFNKFNKNIRGREDELMKQLAKNKNWKRCPKCKFYVERSSGCMYMKCRCGFAFCYNCTAPSKSNSHICSKCKH